MAQNNGIDSKTLGANRRHKEDHMKISTATRCTALCLLAVFAAVAPAGAQEAKNYRLGLQVHFAMPTGTVMYDADSEKAFDDFLSMGFGASATFEYALGGNSSVRARLEYLAFGDRAVETTEDYGNADIHYVSKTNYDMKIVGLAADYAYSIQSLDAGPYVFGGLGYYSTMGSGLAAELVVVPPFQGVEDLKPLDGNGSSLGLSVGAGYRFTKSLGCEAGFTLLNDLKQTVKYGGDYPGEEKREIGLSWLHVSLCYRF
jgi:hypothetical protein